MGQFNQILTFRFNDLLRRLFGIKVPGGDAVSQLAPEIMGTGDVFSFQQFAEHFGLLGVRLWAVNIAQAASVGNFSVVGVRNPAGSGTLSVVTGVVFTPAVAIAGARPQLLLQTTVFLAGLTAVNPRDSRIVAPIITQQGKATPAGQILGGVIDQIAQVVNVTAPFSALPVVLFPGSELDVQSDIVNEAVQATFLGYERPFEVTEGVVL